MNKGIFITDLHLTRSEDLRNQIQTIDNLNQVLKELDKESFDFLILGGDLCYEFGELDIYNFIKLALDELDKPYFIIPGNHDDSLLMANAFDLPIYENQVYYKQIINGLTFLFLDTAIGSMSEKQWEWLEQELVKVNELSQDVFIIMHHPPTEAFISYLDISPHQFKEIVRWENLMDKYKNITPRIFCGHFHCELSFDKKSHVVYVTPSCYLQFDDRTASFSEYHRFPGYRRLWWNDSSFYTSVKYVFK